MKNLLALIAISALLAGRNTTEGDKDIKNGGEAIEKAADNARH